MLPDAPGMISGEGTGLGSGMGGYGGEIGSLRIGVMPFSSIAVQVKVGFGGFGVDIATPVASRMNLRVGGSFLTVSQAHLQQKS